MKKILLCTLLVLVMIVPLVLSGCSSSGAVEADSTVKPMTITLYGITDESTTEEAIKEVQDALNVYTEAQFNTHLILRLLPEKEYYDTVNSALKAIEDQKIAAEEEAQRKKEEAKKRKAEGLPETKAPETEAPETEAVTVMDKGVIKTVYPDEKGTQVDIFMVQGGEKFQQYIDKGYLASLNDALSGTSKYIKKFITSDLLTSTTRDGSANSDFKTVSGGTVYGIPCNSIVGEYTYLLVNKEIAERYGYSEADVDTLNELQYFLMDAKRDYPDYITLWNQPVQPIEYISGTESMLGAPITNGTSILTKALPRCMLNFAPYTAYVNALYSWNKENYITGNDYYSLPEEKFAAAFFKGDITAADEYEEDYYVIKFSNPVAYAEDRPGTVFCVSSFASDATRCTEIINALTTKAEFINTFCYGVEGVHYNIADDTGYVEKIKDSGYSMSYENIGNLFLLTPCTDMSEQMLKYAANNWELGKLHNLDVVTSPYSTFTLKIVTKDNYKETSTVYANAYAKALKEAKAAAAEAGETFDESTFTFNFKYPYEFTDTILAKVEQLSKDYYKKMMNYDGKFPDPATGNLLDFKNYIKQVRKQFEAEEWMLKYSDLDNPDSPLAQYTDWYNQNGYNE